MRIFIRLYAKRHLRRQTGLREAPALPRRAHRPFLSPRPSQPETDAAENFVPSGSPPTAVGESPSAGQIFLEVNIRKSENSPFESIHSQVLYLQGVLEILRFRTFALSTRLVTIARESAKVFSSPSRGENSFKPQLAIPIVGEKEKPVLFSGVFYLFSHMLRVSKKGRNPRFGVSPIFRT